MSREDNSETMTRLQRINAFSDLIGEIFIARLPNGEESGYLITPEQMEKLIDIIDS